MMQSHAYLYPLPTRPPQLVGPAVNPAATTLATATSGATHTPLQLQHNQAKHGHITAGGQGQSWGTHPPAPSFLPTPTPSVTAASPSSYLPAHFPTPDGSHRHSSMSPTSAQQAAEIAHLQHQNAVLTARLQGHQAAAAAAAAAQQPQSLSSAPLPTHSAPLPSHPHLNPTPATALTPHYAYSAPGVQIHGSTAPADQCLYLLPQQQPPQSHPSQGQPAYGPYPSYPSTAASPMPATYFEGGGMGQASAAQIGYAPPNQQVHWGMGVPPAAAGHASLSLSPSLGGAFGFPPSLISPATLYAAFSTRVSCACSNCKKAKTRCDEMRPCGRCVRLGREHTCVDAVHQRRGRNPNSSKEDGADAETTPSSKVKASPSKTKASPFKTAVSRKRAHSETEPHDPPEESGRMKQEEEEEVQEIDPIPRASPHASAEGHEDLRRNKRQTSDPTRSTEQADREGEGQKDFVAPEVPSRYASLSSSSSALSASSSSSTSSPPSSSLLDRRSHRPRVHPLHVGSTPLTREESRGSVSTPGSVYTPCTPLAFHSMMSTPLYPMSPSVHTPTTTSTSTSTSTTSTGLLQSRSLAGGVGAYFSSPSSSTLSSKASSPASITTRLIPSMATVHIRGNEVHKEPVARLTPATFSPSSQRRVLEMNTMEISPSSLPRELFPTAHLSTPLSMSASASPPASSTASATQSRPGSNTNGAAAASSTASAAASLPASSSSASTASTSTSSFLPPMHVSPPSSSRIFLTNPAFPNKRQVSEGSSSSGTTATAPVSSSHPSLSAQSSLSTPLLLPDSNCPKELAHTLQILHQQHQALHRTAMMRLHQQQQLIELAEGKAWMDKEGATEETVSASASGSGSSALQTAAAAMASTVSSSFPPSSSPSVCSASAPASAANSTHSSPNVPLRAVQLSQRTTNSASGPSSAPPQSRTLSASSRSLVSSSRAQLFNSEGAAGTAGDTSSSSGPAAASSTSPSLERAMLTQQLLMQQTMLPTPAATQTPTSTPPPHTSPPMQQRMLHMHMQITPKGQVFQQPYAYVQTPQGTHAVAVDAAHVHMHTLAPSFYTPHSLSPAVGGPPSYPSYPYHPPLLVHGISPPLPLRSLSASSLSDPSSTPTVLLSSTPLGISPSSLKRTLGSAFQPVGSSHGNGATTSAAMEVEATTLTSSQPSAESKGTIDSKGARTGENKRSALNSATASTSTANAGMDSSSSATGAAQPISPSDDSEPPPLSPGTGVTRY